MKDVIKIAAWTHRHSVKKRLTDEESGDKHKQAETCLHVSSVLKVGSKSLGPLGKCL